MTEPSTGPDQAETVARVAKVLTEKSAGILRDGQFYDWEAETFAQAAITALTEAGAAMPGKAEELRLRLQLSQHELGNAKQREQRLREACDEATATARMARHYGPLVSEIRDILGPPPPTEDERAEREAAVKAAFYAEGTGNPPESALEPRTGVGEGNADGGQADDSQEAHSKVDEK